MHLPLSGLSLVLIRSFSSASIIQLVCYRRLLKVNPSSNIQSVYEQIYSFPPPFDDSNSSVTTSMNRKSSHIPATSRRDSKGSIREKSVVVSYSQGPFLLVQTTSTGFGDWFLVSGFKTWKFPIKISGKDCQSTSFKENISASRQHFRFC